MVQNQGRIQDFPEFGPKTYYLADFAEICIKMEETGQRKLGGSASRIVGI